jgi:sugar/nucleoside kinase (ribokinase family)
VPGANGAIETGYVRDCLARLGPLAGDVMLVCNEVSLHVVREALRCGHAAGATTVLNPAPAIGIDRSIFGLADIVTPNRTELATLLAGEAPRAGRKAEAAGADTAARARPLLEASPEGPGVRKAVIVTLGASGVVVLERIGSGLGGVTVAKPVAPEPAEPGGDGQVPGTAADLAVPATAASGAAAPAAHAATAPAADGPRGGGRDGEIRTWEVLADSVATVDSTGGGDAFCGALAAALAEGRPLAEAVRRAVAAAALATTHVGAREGMPTLAELEEFLAARPAV